MSIVYAYLPVSAGPEEERAVYFLCLEFLWSWLAGEATLVGLRGFEGGAEGMR